MLLICRSNIIILMLIWCQRFKENNNYFICNNKHAVEIHKNASLRKEIAIECQMLHS